MKEDHYSYAVYADAAMAERFDALRFSGPIGRLIAETQEREIAATGIKSLKVRYNSVFGYFIEVTKSNLASVPAHYTRKQEAA